MATWVVWMRSVLARWMPRSSSNSFSGGAASKRMGRLRVEEAKPFRTRAWSVRYASVRLTSKAAATSLALLAPIIWRCV